MAKEIDAFIEATEQLTALKQTIQKQKDTGAKLQTVYDNFGRIADEVGKLPLKLKGVTDKADATALEIMSACAKVEALTKSVPSIVERIEASDMGRSVTALKTEIAASRAELVKFSDLSQRLEGAMEKQSKIQARWNEQISTTLKQQAERIVEFESRIGLSLAKMAETQALVAKKCSDIELQQSEANAALIQSIVAIRTKQSDSESVLSKLIASTHSSYGVVLEKISAAYKEIAKSTTATHESLTNVRQQEIEMLTSIGAGIAEQDKMLTKIAAKKTSLF